MNQNNTIYQFSKLKRYIYVSAFKNFQKRRIVVYLEVLWEEKHFEKQAWKSQWLNLSAKSVFFKETFQNLVKTVVKGKGAIVSWPLWSASEVGMRL